MSGAAAAASKASASTADIALIIFPSCYSSQLAYIKFTDRGKRRTQTGRLHNRLKGENQM